MRIRFFTGLVAVIAVAAVAGAAPNLEFSIGLCAAKTNAKARLACYDAIAATLKSGDMPPAAAPVPVAPPPVAAAPYTPPPVAAVPPPATTGPTPPPFVPVAPAPPPAAVAASQPEAQFGSEHLAKETRQAAGQPAELDQITAAIKAIAFTPLGRAIVTLENGQVWRQIDGDSAKFKGKEGEVATVERAIFGSYSLTVAGHNQLVKVQRVR